MAKEGVKRKEGEWEFWIDTGGTFTDCLGKSPDGAYHRAKVLSNSSLRASIVDLDTRSLKLGFENRYPDDFFKGFTACFSGIQETRVVQAYESKRCLLEFSNELPPQLKQGDLVELQFDGEAPELGARVITGTPGDRSLPKSRLRLATTKGTNALLERKGAKMVFLVNEGLGDLLKIGNQQRPDLFALDIRRPEPLYEDVIEVCLDPSNEIFNTENLKKRLGALREQGIKTAAICLMHSYQNSSVEVLLESLVFQCGYQSVIRSSDSAPLIRILPRAETTVVDAYLTPVLEDYLDRIAGEFGEEELSVMTSAGGLVPKSQFRAKDSLFSGPAGGLVGAVAKGEQAGASRLIGFDMGGTSTDVARYKELLSYQFQTKVGDARIMAPSLKIETVAAGGGSVCQYDGERLRVGPESAGADPGPACYGMGGPLTITDVNLLLGRMDADQFGIPVSLEKSEDQFEKLQEKLGAADELRDELLAGLLEIANENMTDAIKKISTGEGYDPVDYTMVAFGGAGGQHACGVAEKLGVAEILIPGDAGLLSAFGLSKAVPEGFVERQMLSSYDAFISDVDSLTNELESRAFQKLNPKDRSSARLNRRIVSMRLNGQEASIDIDWISDSDPQKLFLERYSSIFGYFPDPKLIEVVCYRVVVSPPTPERELEVFPNDRSIGEPLKCISSFSGGAWRKTNVYKLDALKPGVQVIGPAIIQDPFSTLFVDFGWIASLGSMGTLQLRAKNDQPVRVKNTHEVEIELFSNRFQTLVDEMGVRLMRTALSTNIKDRLDFSCGLLDADGCLVVNAPHIPVHLGALGMCVRKVSETHVWRPGEMVVTNHPGVGGSHLPDVTVICPMFSGTNMLTGFLVNRAHHAEMGGIVPGSMPPAARSLAEEGVVIPPTVIMRDGILNLEAIEILLGEGVYPSRRVAENVADLKAQVAANIKGLKDFDQLVEECGSEVVCGFMKAIQDRAEVSLRRKLSGINDGRYHAIQHLDDGTPLQVDAVIAGDSMTLQFGDGGGVHPNNFNATPGIVHSAVIYFLRVWLNEAMPLNEGLLRPVTIDLPSGLLNPPFDCDPIKCPPVVAGNVETSQRLVDTLFLAFEVAACSQGTMNNLIFGNDRISFYETIAGGAGAGEGFNGASGVHVHMTNTGITDPELLEYKFPVKLREFSIRKGSGGEGLFRGGDGVIRELEFTEPVSLSLLTQHRIESPYGLHGGAPGKTGEQWLISGDGSKRRLQTTDSLVLEAGDRLRILTPGGGGWGSPGGQLSDSATNGVV